MAIGCVRVMTQRGQIIISSNRHVLEEGDAIYFDSAVRHSYRRVGKNRCSAVIVTV